MGIRERRTPRDGDVLAGVFYADLRNVRQRLTVDLSSRDKSLAHEVRYAAQLHDVEDLTVYWEASRRMAVQPLTLPRTCPS
jgi:hypothetical protein